MSISIGAEIGLLSTEEKHRLSRIAFIRSLYLASGEPGVAVAHYRERDMEVTSILKSPWDSVTQRLWVYPEIFNINFMPNFFSDFPTHIVTPKIFCDFGTLLK